MLAHLLELRAVERRDVGVRGRDAKAHAPDESQWAGRELLGNGHRIQRPSPQQRPELVHEHASRRHPELSTKALDGAGIRAGLAGTVSAGAATPRLNVAVHRPNPGGTTRRVNQVLCLHRVQQGGADGVDRKRILDAGGRTPRRLEALGGHRGQLLGHSASRAQVAEHAVERRNGLLDLVEPTAEHLEERLAGGGAAGRGEAASVRPVVEAPVDVAQHPIGPMQLPVRRGRGGGEEALHGGPASADRAARSRRRVSDAHGKCTPLSLLEEKTERSTNLIAARREENAWGEPIQVSEWC